MMGPTDDRLWKWLAGVLVGIMVSGAAGFVSATFLNQQSADRLATEVAEKVYLQLETRGLYATEGRVRIAALETRVDRNEGVVGLNREGVIRLDAKVDQVLTLLKKEAADRRPNG